MSKQLRIWLFALLGTLLASTTLPAQGVITMTTSQRVGDAISLLIEANGDVTIEGVKEAPQTGDVFFLYTLTRQTITIRGYVTGLCCSSNQLTSLDVSKNTALKILNCSGNQLTSLDLSKNTALETLVCNVNQLTSLDVSKNTALKGLYCDLNQRTSLDVSRNTALTSLHCSGNQLTSLDLSKNAALTELYCSGNQLTNLDLSGCASLKILYCLSNCINGEAMTKLVNSLPDRKGMSSGALFLVDGSSKTKDRNRCSAADVTTSKRKNWEVLNNQELPPGWVHFVGSGD